MVFSPPFFFKLIKADNKDAGVIEALNTVDRGNRYTFSCDIVRLFCPVVLRCPLTEEPPFLQRLDYGSRKADLVVFIE